MFTDILPSSRTISLPLFLNLPFDVLASVFLAFHSPRDLLALCRSHKSFYSILTQRSTQFIWRGVRESLVFPRNTGRTNQNVALEEANLVRMPQKPEWMDEFMFAEMAFGTGICEICHQQTSLPLLDHGLCLQLCGEPSCLDKFRSQRTQPFLLRDGEYHSEYSPAIFPLLSVASCLETFYPQCIAPCEDFEEYPQALCIGSEVVLSLGRRQDFELVSATLQQALDSGHSLEDFSNGVKELAVKQSEFRSVAKKISIWCYLYKQHQRSIPCDVNGIC